MDHNIIINFYHIFFIILALGGIISALFKFYVKAVINSLKNDWKQEIKETQKETEYKFDKKIAQLETVIKEEASTEKIKLKVKDYIDGEMNLMKQDIHQIKEISQDLKKILSIQQETLIAIQMSISELKPKIENLEVRVAKLENGK